MSDSSITKNAQINLHVLESRAREITKATTAISAMNELLEAFRAHNAGECMLDPEEINKIAKNGYILEGLSMGIAISTNTINSQVYNSLEIGKQGD